MSHILRGHCRPGFPDRPDYEGMMRSCLFGERPPSGLWKCSGAPLEIAFFSDQKVAGGGCGAQGEYYISGKWEAQIHFIVHYLGKHNITYEGTFANGKITGTCVQSNGGSQSKFELVFCGKELPSTPQPGQWCGHLSRKDGNEKFHIDFEFGESPYKRITGRGKDNKGTFRIKGRLEGRGLRLLRNNFTYYGIMNEAGTEVVGMFHESEFCWYEGRFILSIGGGGGGTGGSGTAAEPKNGIWFWFLTSRPEYRCYLQLMFGPGTMSGCGRDETGYFTLTGTWKGTSITFTKSTASVKYTGTISVNGLVITGSDPNGGNYNIAFFMEFELPEFPYQFPKKDVSSGQQCAIRLFQEIQMWLTKRRTLIKEFRLLIQKIEQAKSGILKPQFAGEIVDVEQLVTISISLLVLLSGGSTASILLSRFGGRSDVISFSGGAFAEASKLLELYRTTAESEILKSLVEEDVISSRIICYLIENLWDIAGILSTQCTLKLSVQRITKSFLFQAATGIDIISFAFPGEGGIQPSSVPEYDHGKLAELEQSLMECIETITEMNKTVQQRVVGAVGIGIKIQVIEAALGDLCTGSTSVATTSLTKAIDAVENTINVYVSLQRKAEVYVDQRAILLTKLTTGPEITVQFATEMLGVLTDFNPKWCQTVQSSGLLEIFAATLKKVDVIREKVSQMTLRYSSTTMDVPTDILDIVIVGQAIVGLPAIKRSLLFPVPTLQDVVLYEPYGCNISQSTVLGIASGTIRPSFRQLESQDVQVPSSWNSLLSGTSEQIPSIFIQQSCIENQALQNINGLLDQFPDEIKKNRLVIPFFTTPGAQSAEPIPLWLLTSACAVVGMVSGVNVRVHLASSLSVPDPTPELQQLCQSQYSFAQTSMGCELAQLSLQGINQSWLDQFVNNESLASLFTNASTRNVTVEGGVVRITTTTTTTSFLR